MVKSITRLFSAAVTFYLLTLCAATPASAAVTVILNSNAASVPVGGTLTFTATPADSLNPSATFLYRFNVRPTGTSAFSVVRDFYEFDYFYWTPSTQEGSYDIQVVVQSSAGGTASAIETVAVTSRITGSSPVVSPTSNSLVALYSAPPCTSGNTMRVRFQAPGDTTWQMTPSETCDGVHSLNFYAGGMRASTTYTLQQENSSGSLGPQLTFTTGSVPSNFNDFNPFRITPAPASDTTYPFELHCANQPYATDLQERIVWYLPANFGTGYLVRAVPGGTFIGILDEDQPGDQKILKEFDMAGNPIRETNWPTLNTEINAYRAAHNQTPSTVRINYISHEGHRLPNGYTLTMVSEERVANQGQGNVDVLGDIILVLDQNFQLVWAWDSFDYLDITRKALLNNTCAVGQGGCPVILFNKQPSGQTYTIANDWTHANSIAEDPSDGNLIISLRHQAWVIKVFYNNGAGDGHIMWRLGNEGNFTLANGVPSSDWFNFQHDAGFQNNGVLTLFDNNNLQTDGADSRGQAWSLDETHLVATLVVDYDLGVRSLALGSAQWLPNGNYWFGAGFINSDETQSTEFTPSGSVVYKDQAGSNTYRVFRIPSMYDQ